MRDDGIAAAGEDDWENGEKREACHERSKCEPHAMAEMRVSFLVESQGAPVTTFRFGDEGPLKGRRLARKVSVNDKSLSAYVVRALHGADVGANEVLVVSGRRAAAILPPTHNKRLQELSKAIGYIGDEHHLSAIAAYKKFIMLTNNDAAAWPDVVIVPWKFGPVPALRVGALRDDQPVYATPLQLGLASRKGTGTPTWHATLQVIGDNFIACIEQYLSEACDLLRAIFFGMDKADALATARDIRSRIDDSIVPKLNLITGRGHVNFLNTSDAQAVRNSTDRQHYHQLYEDEIHLYQAAVAVIRAALVIIEEVLCLGEKLSSESQLTLAFQEVARVQNGGEKKEESAVLRHCLEILRHPIPSDDVAPLGSSYDDSTPWLLDLRIACKFLSELRRLTQNHRADSVFVFVTHHMDVYASEEFYRQLNAYAKERWKEQQGAGRVVVWTGYGRQTHILVSILAKIWLSDLHVIYLPNSLDTRAGGSKELKTATDWVVEETFYGKWIGKRMHFVIAKDVRGPTFSIRDKFLEQIRRYDWNSLPEILRVPERMAKDARLAADVASNTHDHMFTPHEPTMKELSANMQALVNDGIFIPAVRRRFESLMTAMRNSFPAERWRLAQALFALSTREGSEKIGRTSHTRRELSAVMPTQKSSDTRSDDWIRKVLMDGLHSRQIILGEDRFHILEKGDRKDRDRHDTYPL